MALSRLTGEQYELLPLAATLDGVTPQSLFTIRHLHRTSVSQTKVLGIYYILEGVIYKSPSVRGLMKSHIARTLSGLSEACDALSQCARYEPTTGYTWRFGLDDVDDDTCSAQERKRRRRRRVLDSRRPGERTEEEEEGLRASEAIDRILSRLSNSDIVVKGKT